VCAENRIIAHHAAETGAPASDEAVKYSLEVQKHFTQRRQAAEPQRKQSNTLRGLCGLAPLREIVFFTDMIGRGGALGVGVVLDRAGASNNSISEFFHSPSARSSKPVVKTPGQTPYKTAVFPC